MVEDRGDQISDCQPNPGRTLRNSCFLSCTFNCLRVFVVPLFFFSFLKSIQFGPGSVVFSCEGAESNLIATGDQ